MRAFSRRRGIAIIWLLVVLTILTLLMAAITCQHVAGRRWAERRQRDLQADWLARAGIGLAVEHLLNEGKEFSQKSSDLLPESELRVTVAKAAAADTFSVTSQVRYRGDDPPPVVRLLHRNFRRVADGYQVRIEPLAPTPR